ncbi:g13370 [Coccomyxa viridis]|uniref:G13370 protein n=1 Tax=Coccomyxa viridis TaxID=1274662 RepID=A0ABP1GDJ5_9CHLO
MNPEMMKMAMDQMSRMTPQQMADMQRQMASLPPGFVQQQMEAMKSMDPAQLQRSMRDASSIASPGQSQGPVARSSHSMQEGLKEAGNKLFSQGRYEQAAAKYEMAKSELTGDTSTEAAALRQKCSLNLASCYLKLDENRKCVQQCSEVLQSNPEDRKALYRRGQAYSALKAYPAAVADLAGALERSPADERAVIKEKLDEAQQGLLKSKSSDTSAVDGGPGSQQEDPQSSVSAAEEQAMHSVPQAASQVHESSAPFHSIPDSSMPGPDFSPQGMQQTLRMMRQNPALMEQMRTTFASMTPEQMQAAAKMAGMPEGPGFDPQAMWQAADMMASMSPEALEQMTSMAASRHVGLQQQQHPSPQPPSLQTGPGSSQQAVEAMQANPEMMKQAMDMMGQIDPEQMATMMASMQSGSASGQPDPSAMAGLLSDPKSRELMRQMMSSVDPQQLATMSKAAGHTLTPEQAEAMSSQMRNMSDAQMEKLLTTMSWLQSASNAVQKAKQKITENKLLCLALVILLVALLLRWLGFV